MSGYATVTNQYVTKQLRHHWLVIIGWFCVWSTAFVVSGAVIFHESKSVDFRRFTNNISDVISGNYVSGRLWRRSMTKIKDKEVGSNTVVSGRPSVFASDDESVETNSTEVVEESEATLHDVEVLERRLPQAIIIGVKKGGTRALLEFLKAHPDVRAPSPEIHFFDRHYDRGLDWYRRQMPFTTERQLTIEKTPSYFITKVAPGRVRNMSTTSGGEVRLIVVVRDPVTRALSDYTQAAAKRPDVPPFDKLAFVDNSSPTSRRVDTSWGAIKIGLYARHIERWLRNFRPDRIHFVHGERLVSDPAAELGLVQDFLGLRRLITDDWFHFNSTKRFPCLRLPPPPSRDVIANVTSSSSLRCLGKTKGRVHPTIDEAVLERLRDFYRPFNDEFYRMTGIDFGWR